jgi:uncharacterized protein
MLSHAARAAAVLPLLALGFSVPRAHAQADVPKLVARVNDYAGLLSDRQRQGLEEKLAGYEEKTGHQFALLTVPSLHGEAIASYSIRVAESWKIGDKGRDDGLIFVVAKNDRKMRIEVGYGLEGAVPDAIAKRVLDEYVTPSFKAGDFAGGISGAFDVLMKAAEGESLGPAPAPTVSRNRRSGVPCAVVVVAIFLLLFLLGAFVSKLRFLLTGFFFALVGFVHLGVVGGVLGFALGVVIGLTSGSGGGGGGFWMSGGGGGWSSGGSSGGFSSGGFSSGGFSGGGGSFGGGGASGSW